MTESIRVPKGKIEYEIEHNKLHIPYLTVFNPHKGQGIGSILVKRVLSIAKRKHVRRACLDAIPFPENNKDSIKRLTKFYGRFGFKKSSNCLLKNGTKFGEHLTLNLEAI